MTAQVRPQDGLEGTLKDNNQRASPVTIRSGWDWLHPCNFSTRFRHSFLLLVAMASNLLAPPPRLASLLLVDSDKTGLPTKDGHNTTIRNGECVTATERCVTEASRLSPSQSSSRPSQDEPNCNPKLSTTTVWHK